MNSFTTILVDRGGEKKKVVLTHAPHQGDYIHWREEYWLQVSERFIFPRAGTILIVGNVVTSGAIQELRKLLSAELEYEKHIRQGR